MEFYLSFEHLLGAHLAVVVVLSIAILLMTVEGILLTRRDGSYPWKNASTSVGVALGHLVAQAATHGLVVGTIAVAVHSVRLTTIPVSFDHWLNLAILFVLVDFCFYIEHRAAHRMRFMWASHSVHHSSEKMLATTSFRLAWTPIVSALFLFYLPLVWIGFDPIWVYGTVTVNATFQFLVHTELVPHVRWLEWFVNTPSAHRVHHASNPEYIDKNYGGVFLVWDHLFGTYKAEQPNIAIRYGLVHERSSLYNPFVIAYEGLWELVKSMFRPGTARERLARLFGPP